MKLSRSADYGVLKSKKDIHKYSYGINFFVIYLSMDPIYHKRSTVLDTLENITSNKPSNVISVFESSFIALCSLG